MFILPFLKYLKPFKFRLVLAVICMFGVGFFGTYNFLLFKPALDVILYTEPKPAKKEKKADKDSEQFTNKTLKNAAYKGPEGKVPVPNDPNPGQGSEIRVEKPKTKLEEIIADTEEKLGSQQAKLNEYLSSKDWRKRLNGRVKALYYPIIFKAKKMSIWLYTYAADNQTKSLRLIAAILFLAALLKGFFEYSFRYNLSYSLYSAIIQIKTDLFRNIMGQDMRFFTGNSTGFLMSRITSDTHALQQIFDMLIRNGALEAIRLTFIISMLIFMSPRLTAIVFLGVVPAVGVLAYFAYTIKKVARKQKRKQDVLSAVMNESLTNVRLVKSLSTEEHECEKFETHNKRLFFYQMQRRVAKFAASPIMEVLGTIGLGAIILAAGWVVIRDKEMQPTEFMVYLAVLTQFYGPLKHMSRINVSWQQGAVSAARIMEILGLRASIIDPQSEEAAAKLDRVQDGLTLHEVSFRYNDKVILDNISLEIPAGRTTALVGRSGSGKSTLANLLLRLYDPDEGAILLDHIDLRAFKIKDLRRHFGIVTQETFLFNDTIANNIAYGCDDCDMDRIVDAAKAAHAHEFIMELDGGRGYDTNVGPNGCQLSGGQRQRIAIARAFYRDPEILILDEATSSLDTQSEAAVQEALELLMKNRTVVVISHRLSTIKNADTIIVLEAGRIIEAGTHAELVAYGGHYALLCKHGDLSVDDEKSDEERNQDIVPEASGDEAFG